MSPKADMVVRKIEAIMREVEKIEREAIETLGEERKRHLSELVPCELLTRDSHIAEMHSNNRVAYSDFICSASRQVRVILQDQLKNLEFHRSRLAT